MNLSASKRFRFNSFGNLWVNLAAIIISLSGCSAVFVAPYDETTDRLLTDLSVRTETAVAQADAGHLSERDREQFFDNAIGTVRTLKTRSSLFDKNQDEVNALSELEKRYQDLRQHGGQPRSSLATGLRASLLDLQQIEVAKKRSKTFTTSLKKSS
jgi:hypothetical protein